MEDPVVIPWGVAIKLFRDQILMQLNKQHGMSPKEAKDWLDAHKGKAEPKIEALLAEITRNEHLKTERRINNLFNQRTAGKH